MRWAVWILTVDEIGLDAHLITVEAANPHLALWAALAELFARKPCGLVTKTGVRLAA